MRLLAVILLCVAGIAQAAPDTSKRPVGRPGSTAGGAITLQTTGTIIRPEPTVPVNTDVQRGRSITQSLRPELRPRSFRKLARQREKLRRAGAVCNDPDIQGERIGAVPGRIRGCGVANAVRVRSVSGVTLSQTSIMDCSTANALKTWVDNTAKPALRRTGGGLRSLRVAAHYACRTRNNRPGAKISEHGRGRAIDISAVGLRDGSRITVLKGWKDRKTSKIMRQLHAGACGPFGTVLGPNSDRFHQDHFHFDTARYRSGSYCR